MSKVSFERLLEDMQHFLNFPDIEDQMDDLIKVQTDSILLTDTSNGSRPPEDVLSDYLKDDNNQNRLKAIIALSGGSLEKLKRIVEFWFQHGVGGIKRDAKMRKRVAEFFINSDSAMDQIPRFIRRSFCLPDNWIELLKDDIYMSTKFREKMVSKYSVSLGFKLENLIGDIVDGLGYSWEKGGAPIVDNKEVDVAIPSCENPRLLIMVSYSLTTSSAQSSRAGEQTRMYEAIRRHNNSRINKGMPDCLLVNVMDGGGWISRKNDLEQIWQNCDYCFSYNTLGDLGELINKIMSP